MTTRRIASVIELRSEKEADYRALHAAVWPGVVQTLHDNGVRNYSIFLHRGLLFSYLEFVGDDYEAAMAAIASDPVTKEWWTLTDPCQTPVTCAEPGEWWVALDEVFHLD
jgi:L-rhamnose mutarotase